MPQVQATSPDDTNIRRLNNYCRKQQMGTPEYPDPTKGDYDGRDWTATVRIGDIFSGQGKGSSRKKAKQAAAAQALEYYGQDYIDSESLEMS